MKDTTRYLDEKQVSQLMGLALPTLRNWRFLRKGPSYVKLDRAVRYALSDVIAYLESRKIQTNDSPSNKPEKGGD